LLSNVPQPQYHSLMTTAELSPTDSGITLHLTNRTQAALNAVREGLAEADEAKTKME
jgi:hypothetical protein